MVSDVQSAGMVGFCFLFFFLNKNQSNQLKQDGTTTNFFYHLGMVANI